MSAAAKLDDAQLAAAVDAVFALEADDHGWLRGVVSALIQLSGPEHQCLGFFYDAASDRELQLRNVCVASASLELEPAWLEFTAKEKLDGLKSMIRNLPVGWAWTAASSNLGSLQPELARNDWANLIKINCGDPSGIGCLLLIGCRPGEFRPLLPAELAMYQRLAGHLVTAFRCRRRLGAAASSPAADSAQHASARHRRAHPSHGMSDATAASTRIAQQRVRTVADSTVHAHRQSLVWQKALKGLQPSVGARLTLVDTFEESGSVYVVAREGEACAKGIDTLTERERQVVEFATLGFTNKEIGYALGISDATVRVLMARAAGRVGVHTRRELLAHPAIVARRAAAAQ